MPFCKLAGLPVCFWTGLSDNKMHGTPPPTAPCSSAPDEVRERRELSDAATAGCPHRPRGEGPRGSLDKDTANLRTKILDFRGSDSSRILILRGGILISIGNFPGNLSQAILVRRFLVGRVGVDVRAVGDQERCVPPTPARAWTVGLPPSKAPSRGREAQGRQRGFCLLPPACALLPPS